MQGRMQNKSRFLCFRLQEIGWLYEADGCWRWWGGAAVAGAQQLLDVLAETIWQSLITTAKHLSHQKGTLLCIIVTWSIFSGTNLNMCFLGACLGARADTRDKQICGEGRRYVWHWFPFLCGLTKISLAKPKQTNKIPHFHQNKLCVN